MPQWLEPDWPAPTHVRALQTTRSGSMPALPNEPCWLDQVHGTVVAQPRAGQRGLIADAAVTTEVGTVLAIRTADCLPVLLCHRGGLAVGAAHAGWRGLASGVLEATLAALPGEPAEYLAWFGAHISRRAFEVGPEVRSALVDGDSGAAAAFVPGERDRWHADLAALARRRLARLGLTEVYAVNRCTVSEPEVFHSYRRARETGRMAALIWLN